MLLKETKHKFDQFYVSQLWLDCLYRFIACLLVPFLNVKKRHILPYHLEYFADRPWPVFQISRSLFIEAIFPKRTFKNNPINGVSYQIFSVKSRRNKKCLHYCIMNRRHTYQIIHLCLIWYIYWHHARLFCKLKRPWRYAFKSLAFFSSPFQWAFSSYF